LPGARRAALLRAAEENGIGVRPTCWRVWRG